MQQYLELMRHIQDFGVRKDDRTGTGTLSIFGYQMRFDLATGFPLVTTKKVHFKSILHELLWFVRGDTNIRYLVNNGVGIWSDWPFKNWLRETSGHIDCPPGSPERKRLMAEFVERIRHDDDFAAEFRPGSSGTFDTAGLNAMVSSSEYFLNTPENRKKWPRGWTVCKNPKLRGCREPSTNIYRLSLEKGSSQSQIPIPRTTRDRLDKSQIQKKMSQTRKKAMASKRRRNNNKQKSEEQIKQQQYGLQTLKKIGLGGKKKTKKRRRRKRKTRRKKKRRRRKKKRKKKKEKEK